MAKEKEIAFLLFLDIFDNRLTAGSVGKSGNRQPGRRYVEGT
jgi:hypothetical protein